MDESLFSFKVTRVKLLFEKTVRRRGLQVVTDKSGQPRLDTLLQNAFYRPPVLRVCFFRCGAEHGFSRSCDNNGDRP